MAPARSTICGHWASRVTLPGSVDQLVRFVGVGGVASVLYFLLASALNAGLGLMPAIASVLAYAGGAAFAFFAHRRFTFRSDQGAAQALPKFVLATGVGLGLALIIPMILQAFPPMVAFLAVLVIVPICSFVLMKFFVFA